jgi:CO dehydrogenase/acetyl-CoA synthase delta subunit
MIYVYKILVGKPEMKRLLGRPKLRWKDNIKMDPITTVVGYGLNSSASR